MVPLGANRNKTVPLGANTADWKLKMIPGPIKCVILSLLVCCARANIKSFGFLFDLYRQAWPTCALLRNLDLRASEQTTPKIYNAGRICPNQNKLRKKALWPTIPKSQKMPNHTDIWSHQTATIVYAEKRKHTPNYNQKMIHQANSQL